MEMVYITSIVLEYYTLPQIKRLREFNTQFIATHLFHGPISHILVYSGWLLVLLLLSLLDLIQPSAFKTQMFMQLLLLGSLTGIIYATAQIYNGTATFQLITGIFAATTLATFLGFNQFDLLISPVALYFSGLLLTFNSTLAIYFIHKKVVGEKIAWYKSVS